MRHLGGFGLGEDVEGGHAEGDDVGGHQHFRSGAGFVAGQGVEDFGPGFVLVPGGCGEVWQQESDDRFKKRVGWASHGSVRCAVVRLF